MRLTLLGTGTSFGVPVIGCGCAVCTSTDPRDRRGRCAAVVEVGGRTLLIDTPPELRLQLLAAGVTRVDAVLYTHAHADHVAGIDDLRVFSDRTGAALPLYGPADALEAIRRGHAYIFDDGITVPRGTSKPRLTLHPLAAGRPATVAGVEVLPLAFPHGGTEVFGYRIGDVAYVTDAKTVPPEAAERLRGLKVLVLNALRPSPHPTHLSIPEALEVAAALGAGQTFLTHLTHETGHAALAAALPGGVAPGHDGLTLEVG
ncbi:MAG TPA: MBL fold metallo-hydrolase [Gemmatimonadales bacterium]|nr:MBL fold metallo-hydrolase [Gemmatimonadales bacterium]